MDTESARIVLYGITGVAAVVWVASLRYVVRTWARDARHSVNNAVEAGQAGQAAGKPTPAMIVGSAQVEGQPEELALKAASLLAQGSQPMLGPVRIVERGPQHVAFCGIAGDLQGRNPGRWLRAGVLRFTPASTDTTNIDYHVDISISSWLIWLAFVFQLLGLVAIVAGFTLISGLVLPSPNAGVRMQAVQMIQVINFLWEPFLFAGLYGRVRTVLHAALETLVCNLPYVVK